MINTLMQHNEYFRVALYLTCILCLIIGICLPMYIVEIISRIRRHYRNKNEMVHFLKIYKEHALPMATLENITHGYDNVKLSDPNEDK